MNLTDDDLGGLRELQHPGEIQMLWHRGYYDGPLDGLAVMGDRRVWFEVLEAERNYRTYVVFPLTDEELAELERTHALFEEHVGTHTSYHYDANGRRMRAPGVVHPQESHHLFYDRVPSDAPKPDFTDREPIGWFSNTPHNRRARSRRYWARVRASQEWRA